jgi:putative ABC transport system permease protein
LWQAPLEAVLGAEVAAATGLGMDATFFGAHGLGGREGEHMHEMHPYRVVGVFAPTGSVVDRIVLTDVASVWAVHADQHEIKDVARIAELLPDEEKEYTALLVQYASPLAAAVLPRYINQNSEMQSASPAYETARLFTIIGVGVDVLRGFALVLIVAAGLSVFIALYNALLERRYDLAVMRTLGASPWRLMMLMLFEGALLAGFGAVLGIALGHVLTEVLGFAFRAAKQVAVTGWTWVNAELWLVVMALAVGAAAALLPAWRAYRTDVAATLARG